MRLFKPEAISTGVVWVAALGVIINTILARLFYRQRHELDSKTAYQHFLIDARVSAGVVLAGILISYTHLYWLDPVISLGIMFEILFSNWRSLADSFKSVWCSVTTVVTSQLHLLTRPGK